MKKVILLSLITWSIIQTSLGFSQSLKNSPWTEAGVLEIIEVANEQQLVNHTSMYTQEGYLHFAELIIDKLLELKPENCNYNYRKGFLQLEIYRNHLAAIPYFSKATANTHPDVDMFSTRDQRAPADVFYHLGKCYHFAENLDSAAYYYNQFLAKTRKQSELIPVVKMNLEQIETARTLMANPVTIHMKNVGETINTKYSDYSSVVSFDGSALYLTSRRPWDNGETEKFRDPKLNHYPEDVYVSYLDFDSTWMEPIRLAFCQPDINEATIAVSVDERRLYVYDDSQNNGDLYYSDFKNSRFKQLYRLENLEINSPFWEPHCFITNDGKYMFFSSDRPGGFGGLDLYYSIKDENGSWSEPINMGPEINGPYDEDSPFMSISNEEFYFATNDKRSMGGFDILMAKWDGNYWTNPQNLGFPLNRTNDDLYFTTTIDGTKGFLTSCREDGYGQLDIYEVFNKYLQVRPIIILDGEIVQEDGTELPEEVEFVVKLECLDCASRDDDRIVFPRARDGVFMTTLKPCKTYKMTYEDMTDGTFLGEETFETSCVGDFNTIYKRLVLNVKTRELTIKDPKPFVEEPLSTETEEVEILAVEKLQFMHYFDYNKNKLTVAKGPLKAFVKKIEEQLIKTGATINILIQSSASSVPTRTYSNNEQLAEIRGENLKYDILQYLQKQGFGQQVHIVIEKSGINGPEYDKDAVNLKKYKPYQYVNARIE